MKNIFLLLPTLNVFSLIGQKVDLDKMEFNVQFTALAKDSLGPEYTTHSTTLDINNTVIKGIIDGYSPEQYNEAFSIQGFKEVSEKGHFNTELKINNLIMGKGTISSRVAMVDEGKKKISATLYTHSVPYNIFANLKSVSYLGNKLDNYMLPFLSGTWKSSEFRSELNAINSYVTNETKILQELNNTQLLQILKISRDKNAIKFGNYNQTLKDFVWILNNEKHPEHAAQTAAFNTMKSAFSRFTFKELPTEAADSLLSVINYFDDVKKRFASEEKADKKMRYGAFYANCNIYMLLDQPEKAIVEAERLIANDFDPKDGERLRKEALELFSNFKRDNINTRHFVKDLSDAMPPR